MKTKLKLKNNTVLILLVLITIGVIGFAYYYFNVIEGGEVDQQTISQLQNITNKLSAASQETTIPPTMMPTMPPTTMPIITMPPKMMPPTIPPGKMPLPPNTDPRSLGNYIKSCNITNFNPNTQTLSARCKNKKGSYIETSISKLLVEDIGKISNNDGNLVRQ